MSAAIEPMVRFTSTSRKQGTIPHCPNPGLEECDIVYLIALSTSRVMSHWLKPWRP
jgi:hypothetical protein